MPTSLVTGGAGFLGSNLCDFLLSRGHRVICVDNLDTGSLDGASPVGEVLDGLYDRYDGLRDRIAEDGDLRRFANVYVGGEDIRFLDGLDTTVEDGDEVTILPAVAGG